MVIRRRAAADLGDCERLAWAVHRVDGYPPYLPGGDFRAFVDSRESLAAWVTVTGCELVGHVALHSSSSPEVAAVATKALGCPADGLGVVARLFVDPGRRRSGIGRRLLDVAAAGARERGLVPILDVACRFQPAIRLYERSGWQRLGSVPSHVAEGVVVDEHVYWLAEPRDPG